jgi:hypothetical protein
VGCKVAKVWDTALDTKRELFRRGFKPRQGPRFAIIDSDSRLQVPSQNTHTTAAGHFRFAADDGLEPAVLGFPLLIENLLQGFRVDGTPSGDAAEEGSRLR